jgi:hypothetical protein
MRLRLWVVLPSIALLLLGVALATDAAGSRTLLENALYCGSGTGAACRYAKPKLAEVVSVKDFGAVGDGVADDTAAIQAAVNYATTSVANLGSCSVLCPPNSGGSAEVFFPTGLYIVTDTITITGTASLRGDASELTYTGARIKQNTCGKDLFRIAGESTVGAASLQFVNLALMQKSTCSATFVAGTALVHIPSTVTNSASVYFRGVWFQTPEDFAISAETGDDLSITDCTFDVSARKSIKLGSATKQVTNTIISRNYFFFIDVGIVDVVNVLGLQFVGNRIGGRATPRTGYIIDALNTSPVAGDSIIVDHNFSIYANGLLLTKWNSGNVTGNVARLATAPLVVFGGGGTIGNMVVSSNNFGGVWTGTSAIDGSGASVTYSAFIGNAFGGTDGVGGPAGTGITLTGASTTNINLKGNEYFGLTTENNVTGTGNNIESSFTGTGANYGLTGIGGPTNGGGVIGTGAGTGTGVTGTGGGSSGAHGVDGNGGAGGGRGGVFTGTSNWEGVVGNGNGQGAGGAFVGTTTGPAVQSYGAIVHTLVVLTYSGTIATNASLADLFTITATNGTAFTISNPTNPLTGHRITYTIRNTSGGAHGLITWGAAFKTAAAALTVATANSKSIEFKYDGTNWVELFRSAADVAN